MKDKFIDKPVSDEWALVIQQANEIIASYQAQGFDLTLRQLYYQFVARDLIENTLRSYKRLGNIIKRGRLLGLIDWAAIVDRTRDLEENSHWSSPASIIDSCADSFAYDKWKDQPYRVQVWIEKEALIGVIEPACTELDVPYFACRGYSSLSEQYAAGMRFLRYYQRGQEVVVLHFGDHDPSGIDMTRDNQEQLALFSNTPVKVVRVALNMDQIEEYNPPPNFAKESDSRHANYVALYGQESWELDALEPAVIDKLIRDFVAKYRDEEIWAQDVERENEARATLQTMSDRFEDIQDFLNE